MNVELIPHSKATNSYDLLTDVIGAIDDEPNRFNWGDWANDERVEGGFDVRQPMCGTQACVGGWIGLLTSPKPSIEAGYHGEDWFPEATHDDLESLFYAEDEYGGGDDCAISPRKDESQREYADRGIAAIRVFMKKHEVALKAHAIDIPKRQTT